MPIPPAHGQVGLPLSPPKMQSNHVSQQTMRTEKSSEDMLIEGSRKKNPLTSIGEGKEEDKHSSQGDEDAEES